MPLDEKSGRYEEIEGRMRDARRRAKLAIRCVEDLFVAGLKLDRVKLRQTAASKILKHGPDAFLIPALIELLPVETVREADAFELVCLIARVVV